MELGKALKLLKISFKTYKQISLAHSWSPLAQILNKVNVPTPLEEKRGLFNIPELSTNSGFINLRLKCEQKAKDLMNEAVDRNRKRKMVDIFDEMSDTLCRVADVAEFIRIAHPNEIISTTAMYAINEVSSFVEKLNTNHTLYKALKNVVENGDVEPTNEVDNHVNSLFLYDFEENGIHLPEKDRQNIVNLNNAILHLGQQFVIGSSNMRVFNKKDLKKNVLELISRLNMDEPIHVSGYQADSHDFRAREFAYRTYLRPDEKQEKVLDQLLRCRHHLAKMCGFKTYAERALVNSLAEDPETVTHFLKLLTQALGPRASLDFEAMFKVKKAERGYMQKHLYPWDVPYYTNRIRRGTFQVANDEYAPYFSLGACMEGISNILTSLYGIQIVFEDLGTGEAWHEDVYKLAIVHESEGLLGYMYCDFFGREGKPNQDCHFTIQGGRENSDGTYQNPIVALMLNLPNPSNRPSLLAPHMVDNLFHEMGHAMHSMLARTKHQHVAGTRCATDFAEVPSVLMEFFANDPRVIRSFARHFLTGETMPEQMIENLIASKQLFAASEMQLQVFYATLDQRYHGKHPLNGTTTEILCETQWDCYGLPWVSGTAWQLRFSHLVGYGAKYYSYLMARAVASWIWQTHFEKDPFSRVNGDLYRFKCLNFGGGKPAKKIISEFLDREFTPDSLVDALVKETDERVKQVEKYKLRCH